MQIDFAMNIYAAREAVRVLKGEMWGSAWDAGAAACPPFGWNNNWDIYNLRMAEMAAGGDAAGAAEPVVAGVGRPVLAGLALRLIWNAHSIPARCIPLQETQERQEK